MTYPDGENYVCAQCGHEWPMAAAAEEDEASLIVKDANGNLLADGEDRKSTRLNSSHSGESRMPSSA